MGPGRAGIIAIVLAGGGTAAGEPLAVVSQSVRFDPVAQNVHFEIVYNRVPDFFTLDPQERQADAFQFFLDTLPEHQGWFGTSPYPWETIVRGEEIHKDGDIRFRDHINGPSVTPSSGGWGALAGSVPYLLEGTTQTFTAPFSMVNTPTGKFRYALELYEFGTWNGETHLGMSVIVPAPAGVPAVLAGAAALGRRRRR